MKTYPNLEYAAKAVLREKFIVINADIKKSEKSQIKVSNLTYQETRQNYKLSTMLAERRK